MVAVADLYPHPSNVRGDLGDLSELAASIEAVGLLQPLVVKPRTPGGFTVVDGHRRLGALLLTTVPHVPCIIKEHRDDSADLVTMLAAAMHKELTPLELAEAFRGLRNRGMNPAQIARATGYSLRLVNARLLLLELPHEAREMVVDHRLTLADAEDLSRQLGTRRQGTSRASSPKKSAWLTRNHPLAARAGAVCDHRGTRTMVGGVACGQCWEQSIREDTLATSVAAA